MSSSTRRGGIPGPESRTGLTRPSMTEAEFERRLNAQVSPAESSPSLAIAAEAIDGAMVPEIDTTARNATATTRARVPRSKPVKPRRVQRMFAIEEDVDKKLWLYAIHMGKDRSEVVNDLLRPIVASMVLYDSRDRRGGRTTELAIDRNGEGDTDSQN